MKYLILLFLLSCALLSCAQKSILVSGWKSLPIPDKDLAQSYNSSDNEWTVFMKNGKVYATTREQDDDPLPFEIKHDVKEYGFIRGQRTVLKVDDGFLVAYNAGEWGGRLFWFSKDGKERYQISRHQVVKFIKRLDKIYAIEGLAHLSMSEGSIIGIKKTNGKWVAEEYVKLPYAPNAVALDENNNFIVFTSSNLVKVDRQASISVLIEKGFWAYYLYPTSAVIKEKVLYAGMRNGLFRYDLTSGKQEWLMR